MYKRPTKYEICWMLKNLQEKSTAVWKTLGLDLQLSCSSFCSLKAAHSVCLLPPPQGVGRVSEVKHTAMSLLGCVGFRSILYGRCFRCNLHYACPSVTGTGSQWDAKTPFQREAFPSNSSFSPGQCCCFLGNGMGL